MVFANQKGGVGKTTSCVNIAAGVALLGRRVLLVDLDPQGNASSGVGADKRSGMPTSYDVLIGRTDIRSAIRKTGYASLDVLAANMDLAGAEFELVTSDDRERRLKKMLDPVKPDYDYIFIDCPPSLGVLTVNALVAGDGIIIPMQCEYYSLEGLSQLVMSVKKVKKLYNPEITITGILITMYNGRLNLSVQVLEELKKYYGDKLFSEPVVRNVRLSEAPGFGQPIQYYDKTSRGAEIYNNISRELIMRVENPLS
ncbi:MAG: ParA family protein [Clostridia bacterium]|nr:ParA family protein [Clostridia bacterium]